MQHAEQRECARSGHEAQRPGHSTPLQQTRSCWPTPPAHVRAMLMQSSIPSYAVVSTLQVMINSASTDREEPVMEVFLELSQQWNGGGHTCPLFNSCSMSHCNQQCVETVSKNVSSWLVTPCECL